MRVTLRYFDGCPNWRTTLERLTSAIERTGLDAEVALERIGSEEEAERLRFQGSPTVLLDGTDPFADGSAWFGLSCRIYLTEQGSEGSPSEDQLVAAISRFAP